MTINNYIFELSNEVIRKKVSYKNRYGIQIAADLYVPHDFDENTKYPAILIGPPYGGVKEQGPGIYGNEMAQRGFVALAFDPSYNGFSGGEQRHLSSPDLFVEDFHAGVDFLGTRQFVDREKIAVIGICGSGAFALSAAQVDTRIKAVVTTSMVDMSTALQYGMNGGYSNEEWQEMLKPINEQRYVDFQNNQQELAPRSHMLQLDENKDPMSREFAQFYATSRGYHPNSICTFTLTSNMSFMNFSLLGNIKRIAPRPIMLVVGENALSRMFSDTVYALVDEAKEMVVVPECNHIDLYDRIDKIPFAKIEAFITDSFKG